MFAVSDDFSSGDEFCFGGSENARRSCNVAGRSVMFARLIERVEIHLNKLAPENN